VVEGFDNLQLVFFGQDIFGLIIANSISKGAPFQVWQNLNYAMDACSFFTHIWITSSVESMLCMSMQSFGLFVGSHTQIKTHKLA
jgi:hypothetical protein